jgi:hypothetical protein
MSHDFELKRLTDKIKKIAEEQTKTNHQIQRARREEQMELDYIRRRFNSLTHALETKQRKQVKDMTNYERQLTNLQRRLQDKKDEETSSTSSRSPYNLHRNIR